jgi:hypothetical protein
MSVVVTLVWFLAGAIAGWTLISLRASRTLSRARAHMREQMHREIRYWQAETERYKAVADRLNQEKQSWVAGCKQGRDDVISIVPLLIAAQQRLMGMSRTTETSEMDDCA